MSTTNENNTELNKDSASFDPSPSPEFLREKIKQKPINKKKLLRRTLLTVLAAAVFGLVACLTFLLLEPLIYSTINKPSATPIEPEVSTVVLSNIEDEINPEDMYATDTEMIEEALQGNTPDVSKDIQNIEHMISDIQFGVEDYRTMYKELSDIADSVSQSVVTITASNTEADIISNNVDSSVVSGLIVADNGQSLLILAKNEQLLEATDIIISFCNGEIAKGQIYSHDSETGYMIISVPRLALTTSTLEVAIPAKLGTSRSSTLKGTPIMALGSPTGMTDSLSYGIITTSAKALQVVDSDFTLLCTDIAGSENSSGIIVNLRGYVIGIIDMTYSNMSNNQICALGITEIKPLIEKLSNKDPKAYLGVIGTDITVDMAKLYNIPEGIYFSSVSIDSPAMYAGLQSGDILTAVNGQSPNSYHDFINWLFSCEPEEEVRLTISRQSVDAYISLTLTSTLGQIDYEIVTEE